MILMPYPTGPKLGSIPPRLVGVLNVRGNEPLTQSVYPAGAGFVQAKALDHDTVIQLFTRARDRGGVPVYDRGDEMKLLDAGHGSQIAYVDGGVVFPHGNDPMWIPFKVGRFTRSDATLLHVGTEDYTVVSVDLNNDLAVLRSTQDKGKRERFDVTRWSHIKPGSGPLPSGWRLGGLPPAGLRGTFQGCNITGDTIYAVYGETTGKADYAKPTTEDQVWAYAWDWQTGKQTGRENYTTVSRLPGDVPRSSEPEAIFTLELDGQLHIVIAVKSGSGDDGDKDEREIRLMAVAANPKEPTQEESTDMATSQNGWTAASTTAGIPGGTTRITPKGAPDTAFTVRKGDVATVFQYLIDQYQARVEDIDLYTKGSGDDWGFAARPIRGSSTTLSNHMSATAIDINATRHPLGVAASKTFTPKQLAAMRAIIAELRGAVRCGAFYTGRPDGMHWEIDTTAAKLKTVAADIRSGKIHGPTPIPTVPATPPAPPVPLPRVSLAAAVAGFNAGGKGDVSEEVRAIQRKLGVTADGYAGPKTRAAMAAYQVKISEPPKPTPWPEQGYDSDADGIPGRQSLITLGFEVLP